MKSQSRLRHAKLASAVLLVVEIVFAEELVATFLKSVLAPILWPEGSALHGFLGCKSGLVDLLQIFPTRRG